MKGSTAGHTEWLFFHLWKRDEKTGRSCSNILVPDTIIYRWSHPYFWYFTSRDGEIMRKSRARVNHKCIQEDFLSSPTSSNIMASYFSFVPSADDDEPDVVVMEHLNEDGFNHFIVNKEKSLAGVLQKWVEPKGDFNFVVRVNWSSQFCIMEKRTNINPLMATKVDFYERIVTYEGPEHLSIGESITSPTLTNDIQRACLHIVDHIKQVTGGNVRITRMILHFKIDECDRLWLVFCNGLRVSDIQESLRAPGDEIKSLYKPCIPAILSIPKEWKKRSANQEQSKHQCIGCNNYVFDHELFNVTLRTIIKTYENGYGDPPNYSEDTRFEKKHQAALQEDINPELEKIPSIVRRYQHVETLQKYQELRKDASWLLTELKLCQNCCLHFTQTLLENKRERKLRILAESKSKQYQERAKQRQIQKQQYFDAILRQENSKIATSKTQTTMNQFKENNQKKKILTFNQTFPEIKNMTGNNNLDKTIHAEFHQNNQDYHPSTSQLNLSHQIPQKQNQQDLSFENEFLDKQETKVITKQVDQHKRAESFDSLNSARKQIDQSKFNSIKLEKIKQEVKSVYTKGKEPQKISTQQYTSKKKSQTARFYNNDTLQNIDFSVFPKCAKELVSNFGTLKLTNQNQSGNTNNTSFRSILKSATPYQDKTERLMETISNIKSILERDAI